MKIIYHMPDDTLEQCKNATEMGNGSKAIAYMEIDFIEYYHHSDELNIYLKEKESK